MKELDKEYISKRKDQKAYNYFDSGFVGEILVSTSACTSIPCGWNKSTKKIIKPKRISEIAVRKKMRSSMRDKPKDTIPREEKRMQELNLFDPRSRSQTCSRRALIRIFLFSVTIKPFRRLI